MAEIYQHEYRLIGGSEKPNQLNGRCRNGTQNYFQHEMHQELLSHYDLFLRSRTTITSFCNYGEKAVADPEPKLKLLGTLVVLN